MSSFFFSHKYMDGVVLKIYMFMLERHNKLLQRLYKTLFTKQYSDIYFSFAAAEENVRKNSAHNKNVSV